MTSEHAVGCESVAELLPWWLNGTLASDEARDVQEHIQQCDSCRAELRQTRRARDLHAGHVPAEELVDYALGNLPDGPHFTLVQEHVQQCEACRQELELVTSPATRDAGTGGAPTVAAPTPLARANVHTDSVPPGTWGVQTWRRLAVAATLTTFVLGAGWFYERWQWQEQARTNTSTLQEPVLNPPVLNLLASTPVAVARGSQAPASAFINEVTLPAGSPLLTLVLLDGTFDEATTSEAELQILDAQGQLVWQGNNLTRNRDGHFTLTVPAEVLPQSAFTLQVMTIGENPQVLRYEVKTLLASN